MQHAVGYEDITSDGSNFEGKSIAVRSATKEMARNQRDGTLVEQTGLRHLFGAATNCCRASPCLPGEDTAFALCFHCLPGADTAFTNTAFTVCFPCRRGERRCLLPRAFPLPACLRQ